MKEHISVLMSVYVKEKPSNLVECFDSLLKQTVLAEEWVIVKDGPLTDELESVLSDYDKKNPNLIKFLIKEKNEGLGLALRDGLLVCSNEIIARMDTDDIAVPHRFEKQLKEFEKNPNIAICGSQIKEFEGSIDNIVSERIVPIQHDDIVKYQKRRSAFNHMTVMFKKSEVLKAGNYQHAPLMEDDLLWVNMLKSNCLAMNIDEFLVYARVGLEMIGRRGGYSYFIKYKNARKQIYETGFISYWDYVYTLIIQFAVALVPSKVRIYIFTKLLRKKV